MFDLAWAVLVGSVALLIVALGISAVISAIRDSRRDVITLDDRERNAAGTWLAGATGSQDVEWSRTLLDGLVEQINNGRRVRR